MDIEAGPGLITVEQVDAAATYPLRAQELRQGRPVEIDEDDAPYTLHLAARLDGGEVVGVVRFHPRDCPWRETEGTWQLRGMATDPRVRGLGAGRALVAEGLTRVAARGGQLVWCDAREAAVGFYRKLGFQVVTEPYDLRPVGTHRGMVVELPIR
ncbi:GNAT family N-acetyltransferase [Modestobacter sp. I12A-02628]|uniref:GNAT family N-acetyltransferase n=1 Tax=Goekera deserti TaxID=2497753 RepID=A0A7K3WJ83_9ACTN|nr:GNAT family N-acetyltransferase [Goekera deserti]MPQ99460.1 GNAT family N-acetyltransferase [Goekera deserti]NDI48947.1 GNAT family N-acetyltransferase [Goekera deserti]NEL55583.1 GNAT family N-acetyltransferase [Goekera deserti]